MDGSYMLRILVKQEPNTKSKNGIIESGAFMFKDPLPNSK